MNKRAYAKQLLIHYFIMCAKESGFYWDSDNVCEIEEIVDLIIDAAIEEIRKDLISNKEN